MKETTFWKGHAHNLPIELAVSYGLPAAIIFCTIIIIIFLSGKIIFSKESDNLFIFDRAFPWHHLFLSSRNCTISNTDGKISIIAWILISGLKNIIENQSKNPLKTLE